MPRAISLPLFWLLVAVAGCAAPSDPAAGGGPPPPQSAPSMQIAIVDWRTADFTTPEALERYSRTNLLVVEAAYLWGTPANADAVALLKARNPNLKVIGYVLAHTTRLIWAPPPDDRPANGYGREWYDRTLPFWVATTTGDTMLSWPGQVMLDLANPLCRQAIVQTVAHWQAVGGNPLDGLLWDYFSAPFWYAQVKGVSGDPDVDRDGVPHQFDADEQDAMLRGQEALVLEMRAALGGGLIQIFNGNRARVDSAFAALGDGMMYELFPEATSGCPPAAQALDPSGSRSLFAATRWPRRVNGGPWLLLSNIRDFIFTDLEGEYVRYYYADLNRAVALLTDAAVSYHRDRQWWYGWPEVELDLGRALGPATRSGDVLTRRFERGTVTVTLSYAHPAVPLSFEIVQDGQVVQALDLPHHVP